MAKTFNCPHCETADALVRMLNRRAITIHRPSLAEPKE
jgi:hypothetical protein